MQSASFSKQHIMELETCKAELDAIRAAIGNIIIGKEQAVRQALTCLLAGGHILIEDVPGVGKTTLAHALAHTLGLEYQRIQFTSDLLPADILGVNVYDRETGSFHFHPGPVFSQLILADEINRATPKTQSALLEAMEEQQVSIEGVTHRLPSPFFVIATQNPLEQAGTFPLPESQLDRFILRISLGYPDAESERALLMGEDRRTLLKTLQPVTRPEHLIEMQQLVSTVRVSEALIDYIQSLIQWTRSGPYQQGLSPRAGLALLRSGRAWALLDGRDFVLPEDIQAILPGLVAHRLTRQDNPGISAKDLANEIINEVAIP
jgi:MoxR-like ATPase